MYQQPSNRTPGAGVFLPANQAYVWIIAKWLLLQMLKGARSVWRAHRRHRTIRSLQELDDATLRDIGLNRSQIGSAVAALPDDAGPPSALSRMLGHTRP